MISNIYFCYLRKVIPGTTRTIQATLWVNRAMWKLSTMASQVYQERNREKDQIGAEL
jgi:hypothetical protein